MPAAISSGRRLAGIGQARAIQKAMATSPMKDASGEFTRLSISFWLVRFLTDMNFITSVGIAFVAILITWNR